MQLCNELYFEKKMDTGNGIALLCNVGKSKKSGHLPESLCNLHLTPAHYGDKVMRKYVPY